MTGDEFSFNGASQLPSPEQLIDIKSMTLALYLFCRALGSLESFKVMVSYAAKAFGEKWELAPARAELLIGQALSLLIQEDWVHVMISRDGKFTHAANADPDDLGDDERMIEFFRRGLAIAPARPKEPQLDKS
jgi:hypothetical protein